MTNCKFFMELLFNGVKICIVFISRNIDILTLRAKLEPS